MASPFMVTWIVLGTRKVSPPARSVKPRPHDAELAEIFSPIAKNLHGYAQAIDTEPREGAVREPSLIDELRPQLPFPFFPTPQFMRVIPVHPHVN